MKYYEIAGLTMSLEYAGFSPLEEFSDFETNKPEGDVDIEISMDEDINRTQRILDDQYDGVRCLTNDLVIVYELEDSYTLYFHKPRGIVGFRINKNEGKATISRYLEKQEGPSAESGVCEVGAELTLEDQLLFAVREIFFFYAQQKGRVAIHSASHIYDDKAWLFSAKSGVGKSSHVKLWKDAGFDTEDLNGDVTMCYVADGCPMAAGLPWSGSSGINHNKTAKLGGVFFIEQAPLDKVYSLDFVDTVLRLNARCFTPNWDAKLVERNVDNSMALSRLIKSYGLECTLSTGAAQMAKNAIDLCL